MKQNKGYSEDVIETYLQMQKESKEASQILDSMLIDSVMASKLNKPLMPEIESVKCKTYKLNDAIEADMYATDKLKITRGVIDGTVLLSKNECIYDYNLSSWVALLEWYNLKEGFNDDEKTE